MCSCNQINLHRFFSYIPKKLASIPLPENPLNSQNYKCLKERVTQAWNNGKTTIIAFAIAWAIVIAWSGSVYGFNRVAKNLSIGLGIGMGVGLIVGGLLFSIDSVTMHSVLGTEDKSHLSLINLLAVHKESLNNSVMAALVTTVLVSMTMNALPQFPLGVGCIAGAFMGQHLAITCGTTKPKPVTAATK